MAATRGEPWFEPAEGDRLDASAASDALRRLPIEQREVIVARLWGGLSFEEIARVSEMSLSKVYRSYQRGLAALRESLDASCSGKRTKAKT